MLLPKQLEVGVVVAVTKEAPNGVGYPVGTLLTLRSLPHKKAGTKTVQVSQGTEDDKTETVLYSYITCFCSLAGRL